MRWCVGFALLVLGAAARAQTPAEEEAEKAAAQGAAGNPGAPSGSGETLDLPKTDAPGGKAKAEPAPSLRGKGAEMAIVPGTYDNPNGAPPPDSYKGVAPGTHGLPPRAPRLPIKRGPQRLTWPGFQVKDGVPTVFLEVTGTPDYQIQEGSGALVVTLRNTVVPIRNNRRPLNVAFFETPVQEVEAQQKGHSVQVRIRCKGGKAVQHKERVEDAAGGYKLLIVELPRS